MTLSRIVAVVVLAAASTQAFAQAPLSFAIIADYGTDSTRQASVAARMASYNPSFVTTLGDNTYFLGTTPAEDFANWDKTQGKYYAPWIDLPSIAKGSSQNSAYLAQGAAVNNFFPVVGNHDIDEGLTGYKDYFKNTPAGASVNYYKFTRGNVEFFMLSSDPREPDGRTAGSTQYTWAESNIKASTAAAQVVMFHHPAWLYANSSTTAETAMRWDYKGWGVDAVFSGHSHNFMAMDVSGLPYFVMGASGRDFHTITGPPSGATGLYANSSNFGFAMVDVTDTSMTVSFIGEYGDLLYTQVVPIPEPGWYLLLSTFAMAGFITVRRYRSMAKATQVSLCC